jgi:hypothetical protein
MRKLETHTEFWSENLKRRDSLEDLKVDEMIILKWEGEEWIHVAQFTDQWRAVVITIMNLRIS